MASWFMATAVKNLDNDRKMLVPERSASLHVPHRWDGTISAVSWCNVVRTLIVNQLERCILLSWGRTAPAQHGIIRHSKALDKLQIARMGSQRRQRFSRAHYWLSNLTDLYCIAIASVEDNRTAPLHRNCAAENPSIC